MEKMNPYTGISFDQKAKENNAMQELFMNRQKTKKSQRGGGKVLLTLLMFALSVTLFSYSPKASFADPPEKVEAALQKIALEAAESGDALPDIIQFFEEDFEESSIVAQIIKFLGGLPQKHYDRIMSFAAEINPQILEYLAQDPAMQGRQCPVRGPSANRQFTRGNSGLLW